MPEALAFDMYGTLVYPAGISGWLVRPIGEVRLVSSNPFDDIGAQAAGMKSAWVDRSGGLFGTLGPTPEIVVGTLTELVDALN